MDFAGSLVARTSELDARSGNSGGGRPPVYRAVGISLAVASGLFIGISFVLKKTGLLKANVKYNEEAGEGYGYLKNVWWWSGMTLMILGELCNFVAYAFVDAILVTPLGALSVVVTTILSAIFLKERLSFVGKVGCFSCLIGSVVIAMNAPKQSSVSDIQEMQDFVVAPGFLTYAGVIIVGCTITALWAGPRYGKRSMFVYLSICSLIGGLSVVATQGLGAAVIAQINGESQFTQWFLYVVLAFVVATLVTEIIYLNKALNIFNAALVTPTYYVFFTSATIVTSAILFQGFNASGVELATIIMGFLQICIGVVLLQLSKSAKDVPDTAVFKGDLDQVREVVTQEEPEIDPRADSIRGTAALMRRLSTPRRHMEQEEARRLFREKREDSLSRPSDNEIIEWDGLRRRRTVVGEGPTMSRPRTPGTPGSARSAFPPLGMTHFPPEEDEQAADEWERIRQSGQHFFEGIRSRASVALHSPHRRQTGKSDLSDNELNSGHPVALTDVRGAKPSFSETDVGPSQARGRSGTTQSIHWADEVDDQTHGGEHSVSSESLPYVARRQFSFNTMFNRIRGGGETPHPRSNPPRGILRRTHEDMVPVRPSTEEERLGLVQGDPQALDEKDMNEELERTWSTSSDGSRQGLVEEARPRGPSASSMSTTSFPRYEEHDYYASANMNRPPEVEGPTTRNITADGSRSRRRATTTQAARTNPLPPLPDEDLVVAGRGEPSTQVESLSSANTDERWRRPTGDGGHGA